MVGSSRSRWTDNVPEAFEPPLGRSYPAEEPDPAAEPEDCCGDAAAAEEDLAAGVLPEEPSDLAGAAGTVLFASRESVR